MEQVDDDVADTRQKVVEAGLRSFLAECFLENAAQQLGDIAKILGVDADGVEGARGDVELISETNVDVGDFALGSGAAGP
jgi:hypothetical protein